MSDLKLPPQNLEAEKSVLGALLIDSDAVYKVVELLAPDNFYKREHYEIFKAMVELYANQTAIDVLTLSSLLKKKKLLSKVGGAAYLSDLVASVPTAAHVEEYSKIIKECFVRRKMITMAAQLDELSYDEQKPIDEVIDEVEKSLLKVAETNTSNNFVHVSKLLEEAYERAEELNKNPGQLRGVASGFPSLDSLLGGFQRSDLVIVAARPSVGKTSLALDLTRHAAIREKKSVGIFSVEMGSSQLMDRLLSMEVGVGLYDLRMGRVKDEFFERFSDAMGTLSEAKLFIDDTPGIGIMELRSKARKLKIEHGLDMLIIDYLQLIQGRSQESRVQEVSEISRLLKAIARELDVPVIALSQLSRAVEQRSDNIPMLSDLRDSGSIEQDADVVIFLSRVGGDEENSDNRILSVAKHRNGPTGNVELYFVKEQASFREIDRIH